MGGSILFAHGARTCFDDLKERLQQSAARKKLVSVLDNNVDDKTRE